MQSPGLTPFDQMQDGRYKKRRQGQIGVTGPTGVKQKQRQRCDEIRGDPRGKVSDDATKSPGDKQNQTQVGQRPGKYGKCFVPLSCHHRDPGRG
ncbi:hypothetical protein B7486_01740 [cyanobacterium TDX16]|nr:hypothetical protein B7486_01740 [cyanobacterium TDX16]